MHTASAFELHRRVWSPGLPHPAVAPGEQTAMHGSQPAGHRREAGQFLLLRLEPADQARIAEFAALFPKRSPSCFGSCVVKCRRRPTSRIALTRYCERAFSAET